MGSSVAVSSLAELAAGGSSVLPSEPSFAVSVDSFVELSTLEELAGASSPPAFESLERTVLSSSPAGAVALVEEESSPQATRAKTEAAAKAKPIFLKFILSLLEKDIFNISISYS